MVSGRTAAEQGRTGPYREVRYEALVRDPERALSRLCEFLEIPMDPATLRFHVGKQRRDRGSAKSRWLPPTAGLRDWRRQMRAQDVELFEALAGDLLDSLGLERAGPAASPAVQRTASEAREWWRGFIRRRERKLAKRIRRRREAVTARRATP